ncbi:MULTISPECIES: hypothetical protein [Pseudomonas]|uniref:hypothetical protein n=1 Tax=Pseudomonas TaxID=286 RepID=UPI001473F225|nr:MULTISPECIES: hypothetical protein [Pseudomonas]MBM1204781.1 hypothetical protein [Pseudomonas fragi]MBM1204877.1 hypothetical protein [Pseudomonas fragi]NMY57957.1 hypothetical protein [Pseudomonas sp. WS 5051]
MIYLDEIPALDRILISGMLAVKLEDLAGGLEPLARVKAPQQVAEYLEQLGVNLSAPVKPLVGFSLSDRTCRERRHPGLSGKRPGGHSCRIPSIRGADRGRSGGYR